MHGFSIALPSLLSGKASFPRSASSPTLPDLSRPQFNDKLSNSTQNEPLRSASYPVLPNFDWNFDAEEESSLDSSTHLLATTDKKSSEIKRQENNSTENEKPSHKRHSLVAGPRFWKKKAKGQLDIQQTAKEEVSSRSSSSNSTNTLPQSDREIFSRSLLAPFSTITRKSWIPPRITQKATEDKNLDETKKTCDLLTEDLESTSDAAVNSSSKYSLDPLQEFPKMTFHQLFESPCSTLIISSTLESTNSSIISLNESFLDNQSTPRTSTDKVQALPNDLSSRKNEQISIEGYGKRDELHSVFRALENDYNKFQSKSWSLKMNVVRSSLVPFLRNNSESTSITNLRPEDLERRVIVLNKWWTGLLDMLDGKHSQTISGVDRPLLLQGCFDIMIRPEWRYSLPVPIYGENEKVPSRSVSRRTLLTRMYSTTPAYYTNLPFLIESINQNIRKLYIHNLTIQVNFAVEKMSLRCAPASLVAFCGKAVAYAFFFVPGLAEILVRIWRLQPEILRRVSDELEIPRRDGKIDIDDVIASFPSHLHCLAWNSVKSMSNFLRKSPIIPAMFEKTVWYGPWVARWCGRDSDLFFIFVKNYLIISESLFSPDFTLKERARAPAQTLIAIDGTIHRQPTSDPLPISFDDVLAGADASATALPLPSNNSIRLMAENRSITLLRDFLHERPSENEKARITFCQLFGKMMQAAAKKTSIFDHSACFILCDFIEEALNIYIHFKEASKFIDWCFWLDVCKKILESENTMSEIRLFALIYGLWDIITADDRRKEVLCLDWLLTEEFFDKYFNHWCPMIRAYYMRLLCWRICRNNGESSDLDIKIFHTVFIRIRSNWEYYLHMKFQAETNNSPLPFTSPCLPAPGRRLLIIRNDNPLPTSPLYIGLDGFVSRGSCRNLAQISSFHRNSSPSPVSTPDSNSSAELTTEPSKDKLKNDIHFPSVSVIKKRWSLLGKVFFIPFFDSNSSTCSDEPNNSPPTTKSVSDDEEIFRPLEDCKNMTTLKSHSCADLVANEKASEAIMVYRAFSFRFSLEFGVQFENGNISNAGSGNTITNGTHMSSGITTPGQGLGERRLSPPRLPAPAQALLAAKVPGVSREITPKDWSLTGSYVESHSKTVSPTFDGGTPEKRSSALISISHDENSLQSKNNGNFNTTTKKGNFIVTSIYKGRALAEWAIVVGECNGFLERRRNEGVPNLKLVEVPMLGVEGFRRHV